MAEPIEGSEAWGQQVRAAAQELAERTDHDEFDLGVLLWKIENTLVDTDKGKKPIFTKWGFASFRDYVEHDLVFPVGKATALQKVGRIMATRLVHVPEPLLVRFRDLGWTKASKLCRVFEQQNDLKTCVRWIEYAEKHRGTEVSTAVAEALRPKPAAPAPGDARDDDEDDDDFEATGEDVVQGAPVELSDEGTPLLMPSEHRMRPMSFILFDEQVETVQAALERAEELTVASGLPSWKQSNLLSLICIDFLGTNNFGKKQDPNNVAGFVARFEVAMGLRIIAYREKADDVEIVHGAENLANLVTALSEGDGE